MQTCLPKEPKWSSQECENIKKALSNLLDMGAISKVETCRDQFLSNIFLTPKPDGSQRLILNLKYLNNFIRADHFKLEDHKTVCKLVTKDCFMATLDLKEAYFLLPIAEKDRKFLRFTFKGSLYQFNCMPFGLRCAPLVFTKLMKPVIGHLRSRGLVSVVYLDDFLLLGNNFQQCQINILETVKLLEELGFVINYCKSHLVPSQCIKYLGFDYCSTRMTVSLPTEKRKKVTKLVSHFMGVRECTIRKFAKFIGVLTSSCIAVRYGWLYTKLFERQKFLALRRHGGDFNAIMSIPPSLKADFSWWLSNLSFTKNSINTLVFDLEIFSDASSSGWGVFCRGERAHGFWKEKELCCHINYLELLAAFFGLKCFAKELSNKNILLRIDNTTALAYINRMGSVQHPLLNELSRKIWQWCERSNLFIFASYIKSRDNQEADRESRRLEIETEWEINRNQFQKILDRFGKPEIDLFASRNNNKCEKFVSWQRDPEAFAIDAFTLNWRSFYFYAFPPFSIILRVLQKIITEKAQGIVVVPIWNTQPWFPVFTSLLIEEPLILKPDKFLLSSPSRLPHPLWQNLSLAVGNLSYKGCRGKTSQRLP